MNANTLYHKFQYTDVLQSVFGTILEITLVLAMLSQTGMDWCARLGSSFCLSVFPW